LELIEQRQKAREEKDGLAERLLNRRIRYSTKKDKRLYWKEQLEKEEWAEIKSTKKGFMPKHTRIKHPDGTVAESSQRPDLMADHFENKQWGMVVTAETKEEFKKESRYRTNLLFDEKAPIMIDDYTLEELKVVIKKAKKGKAPGPDGISMDRFKCMEKDSLLEVLNIINRWRLEDSLPKMLTEADVVTIFKKGNVEDPSNYRPIALLQSLYKIHAALLRNWLIKGLDD
jgi:hypothetical protein